MLYIRLPFGVTLTTFLKNLGNFGLDLFSCYTFAFQRRPLITSNSWRVMILLVVTVLNQLQLPSLRWSFWITALWFWRYHETIFTKMPDIGKMLSQISESNFMNQKYFINTRIYQISIEGKLIFCIQTLFINFIYANKVVIDSRVGRYGRLIYDHYRHLVAEWKLFNSDIGFNFCPR